MSEWRFDQARNTAAVTSAAVLAGAPILRVVHFADDDSWGFFDEAPLETANGRVVSMAEAVELDPSLNEIADLSPGWVATRAGRNSPWVREPDGS